MVEVTFIFICKKFKKNISITCFEVQEYDDFIKCDLGIYWMNYPKSIVKQWKNLKR